MNPLDDVEPLVVALTDNRTERLLGDDFRQNLVGAGIGQLEALRIKARLVGRVDVAASGVIGGDDLIGTAVMASVTTDGSPARAEMTRAADGEMHLAVHVPQVPAPEDGYLEVWIRDEAASRMISLGTVTRQDTTLTVPEGVDLASYPVLDVSHEHFDGDPSHSTLSLWVGEMHRTT